MQPSSSLARPHRHLLRRLIGLAALALLIVIAAGLIGAYRASQYVPPFYTEALAFDPVVARQAGDDLERVALDLRNEIVEAGRWEATFTEQQINGWLAVDLEEKFPDLLPSSVREPRVSIIDNQVQVACRYQTERVEAVISLKASIALAEEENTLAVRIHQARAGAIPIPVKQFLEEVTHAAHENNLDVRWVEQEGDPVALIRLPTEHTDLPDRVLQLDEFALRERAAYLSGETLWKPRGKPIAAAQHDAAE
jgi:hypothetical protein